MTEIDLLQVQEFKDNFTGSPHNFGEYRYSNKKSGKGKLEGKAKTIKNQLLTIEHYKRHLQGEIGLGIIPIYNKNKTNFAVIDVDIYGKSLINYVLVIERSGLPVVPFYSKSGGLHLYLFFSEPVIAREAIKIMRKISFILAIDLLIKSQGLNSVEVFPKQIVLKEGDQGSWINLPYYNQFKTKQGLVTKSGKTLTLAKALLKIKSSKTSLEQVDQALEEIPYSDAPPCLQLNYLQGVTESRNNYIFSFAVYLKKKDEDYFEQNLKEVNQDLPTPLVEKEIEKTILSSIRRKDYIYKCNESPCMDFCYKKECKKREFGIGKNEGYFSNIELGLLKQYKTAQPYYEWDVKLQGAESYTQLRFRTEDEIIKQDVFLRLCMRELYELPSKLKQSEWFKKVNEALKEIKIIAVEEDDDTSPLMLIKSLINSFFTERALAENKDQILIKRVFYDEELNRYLFRIKDLTEYVYVTKRFNHFSPAELHGILRGMGATFSKNLRTESQKQVRVAVMPLNSLEEKNTIEFKPDFSEYSKENF